MAILTRASNELFRRSPDETFPDFDSMMKHCKRQEEASFERWTPELTAKVENGSISLELADDGCYRMNDWSFSQVCRLAEVSKDTVNKLSPDLATGILKETLPVGAKPFQVVTQGNLARCIHPASYTRLFNADLLELVARMATGFEPPQKGMTGGTGLYCGEQDMFCFLIDPLGWVEIEGEAFAPGMFLWNSEVGRRTVGIQTFWFQAICQNHIVWDAVEVVEYSRKHTANVKDALKDIESIVGSIVSQRDQRRDGFVKVLKKAMTEKLGNDADEALKALTSQGVPRSTAKEALELASKTGKFTIFSLVDALTRISGKLVNAGERTEADQKAGKLLSLVA